MRSKALGVEGVRRHGVEEEEQKDEGSALMRESGHLSSWRRQFG
jgi:hypothetical protein